MTDQQQQPKDGRALTSGANGRAALANQGPESRALTARNATRHGIVSKEAVIARLGENEGELLALREALWAEIAPVGVVEIMLADLILSSYWRLRRVVVAEGGMIVQRALTVARERGAAAAAGLAAFDAAQLPSARDVERIVRYQSLLTRELFRAIDRLVAVQAARSARSARSLEGGEHAPRQAGENDGG